jgi:sterol 14-demethylase
MDAVLEKLAGQPTWVLVASATVGLLVIYLIFGRSTRPSNAPPTATLGVPLVGTYIEFAKNPVDFAQACLDKFGPVFTVNMLHKKLTFLLGPEASAPFFRLRDDFMSQTEVYSFMTPVFGKGVVYDAEPKKRDQQTQSMSRALLKSTNLEAYVPKIEMEMYEYMRKYWKDEGECNILDALSELTILTSSRCLHGDDVRESLGAEVARLYHDLDKGVTPLSFFFPYAPIPAHGQRDHARAEMVKIFSKVIDERRKKDIKDEDSTDILQTFINMKYKDDGRNLTNDEVVGLLIALLFAGQHTSSITSTWTTMFLLHNERCLKEVFAEQEKILGSDNVSTPLSYKQVGEMEYLQNCVKESLRMHPPLILLMRMAMQDIEATHGDKTFTIPKGDIVITSPAVSSRMPSVFKNPNSFEPERFGAERKEDKVPYSFLGFGGGAHQCLGQQFGLLQVKTIVSFLLRNYELTPVDKAFPEPDFTAMVVGPKNHCLVRYKKRAGSKI